MLVATTITRAFKAPIVWRALLAALGLIVVFPGIIVPAYWDPAGRMADLKVAMVNEDQGFAIPAGPMAGRQLRFGDEVAANLTSITTQGKTLFNWQTVSSREEAIAGLGDAHYDMAIVIPPDFSANLAAIQNG